MLRRLVLLTATVLLGFAAPAFAQPTFTPACDANPACVGLDDGSVFDDSVVVAWRIQTTTPQTVRLRSSQEVPSGTAITATSDPVAVGASSAVQTVSARLPLAAGGQLVLLDATNTPQFEAIVESDRDGDGYGDSTQDACTGNAADHTAPCDGTTTIGRPLGINPDRTASGLFGTIPPGEVQAVQMGGGPEDLAPQDGVLTRWRLRSRSTAGDTVLQVLRPEADGKTVTVVAESEPAHVTSTDITVVDTRLPVKAGDRIAVRSMEADSGSSDLGATAPYIGDVIFTKQPPKRLNEMLTLPGISLDEFRLLVQADVEPDVDHDGYGDVTQRNADLVLTGSAPSDVPALKDWGMSYTVRNDGPDPALGVVLEVTGTAVAPGPTTGDLKCAFDDAGANRFTCKLAKLAAGSSVSLAPTFIMPAIYPSPGGTFATPAMVTATTPDPDLSNNAASLKVVIPGPPPYVPYIPPTPPFDIKACTNIIRGTRDDDVVRGTAFGDRLVGGDGDDLLKGQGADDCLEGGTGNDVLDGGDGNDRLAGSSGRDRLSGGTGDDKLTAGKGNDRLTGGPGNDTLSPGSGRDVVDAGDGNDTINSVDGVKETIDCGAGKDTVRADKRDRLKHCEKVTRR
jgi:hypothetical protein